MKDYYKILQLTPEASFNQVIKNYNTLIRQFKNQSYLSTTQQDHLKEIKEAFFILGDYHNRRKYDNKREGFIKDINQNNSFIDRMMFRPNHKLDLNLEKDFKDTKSDLENNKKIRNNQQINSTTYLPFFPKQ